MNLDNVEILVDLQTGAISVVLQHVDDNDDTIEIECVTASDEFAPQE